MVKSSLSFVKTCLGLFLMYSWFGTGFANIKENAKIMDTIKTLGDFRKLTKDLDDDFAIEFRVRRRVPEEELKTRRYPYPYDTEYFEEFEFDDIGYSDKEICFGVCLGND